MRSKIFLLGFSVASMTSLVTWYLRFNPLCHMSSDSPMETHNVSVDYCVQRPLTPGLNVVITINSVPGLSGDFVILLLLLFSAWFVLA